MSDTTEQLPQPMTLEAAAEMLGLEVSTLRYKATHGMIGYSQSGGRYWFWPHDLHEYLFKRRRSAKSGRRSAVR